MGGSASSLSSVQSAELARLMRIEYEKFCEGKQRTDEEIRVHMSQYYNQAAQIVVTKSLQIVTENARRLNRGLSKDMGGGKKPMGRRKSFGEKDNVVQSTSRPRETKIAVKKQGSVANMATSESDPNLPKVAEVKEEQGMIYLFVCSDW